MRRGRGGMVALVLCFMAVIALAGIVTFNNREKEPEEEQLAETEEKREEIIEEEPSQVTQGEQVQAEFEEEEPVDVKVQEPTYSFSEDSTLYWPIDGNVILNYSMNETIYFATLDQYKYHPAILISGEEEKEVWSAAAGKIESIEALPETGLTVTIDLGNGFKAIYGQLKDVAKAKGEYIEEGELLGYLETPTKYYTLEGCHLYFQLLKDDTPINPLEYLDV